MFYRCNLLTLEKGMYQDGKRSFSQVLEGIDPSDAYYGTPMEGMDAFQRQLKRFDIKVKGPNSDTVEKFFASSASAVLFPEYVRRAVRCGMEDSDILPMIIASETRLSTTEQDGQSQTSLHRRGRMLTASYDAVRRQKLDLFSVVLRQIGAYIARFRLEDAVDTLLNGGEDDGPSGTTLLSWSDFGDDTVLKFWTQLDPFEMDTMLISNDIALALPQNILTGMNFQSPYYGITSFGVKTIRSGTVPNGTIIGLDKRFALEMVQVGDIEVDYEKLIDKKFERAAISIISGFSKIYGDASIVLKVS